MLEIEAVKLRNLLGFGGSRLRLGAFENCRSVSKIVLWNNANQSTCANMLFEAVPVLASGQLRQLYISSDRLERLRNLVLFVFVAFADCL